MRKLVWRISIVLTAVITGILLWHWDTYSKEEALNRNILQYDSLTKRIIVNGQDHKEIEFVHQNGKLLFLFPNIMSALGYSIEKPNQHSLVVQSHAHHYRFFLNRNIFQYNEENYGVKENPFLLIDGEIYIEKQWMEYLFNVKITENEKEIIISK